MEDTLVTEAVLACVRFGNRPLSDAKSVAALIAVRNSLATIFATIARGIASHPNYSRWSADETSPGYLVAKFNDFELRVPWNLVADFPDDAVLDEFLGHASSVKFQGDSVICLSGSLMMRSAVQVAGDIDLCEYVSGEAADFSQVARQAISTAGPDVICFQIAAQVAEGLDPLPERVSVRRPWSVTSTEAFVDRVTAAPTGKCDFALISRSEGAIEMTKLVLRVDARYTDTEGAWDLSFPYQETPLNAGSWIPRRLASPKSIGRYVVWLFREVESHAASAPLKAAKRALSLARILNSAALAEAAQRLLRQEELALRAVLRARLQFRQRLAETEDPALEPFRAQLERTIETLEKKVGKLAQERADKHPGQANSEQFGELAEILSESPMNTAELEGLVAGFRSILEPAVRMGRY